MTVLSTRLGVKIVSCVLVLLAIFALWASIWATLSRSDEYQKKHRRDMAKLCDTFMTQWAQAQSDRGIPTLWQRLLQSFVGDNHFRIALAIQGDSWRYLAEAGELVDKPSPQQLSSLLQQEQITGGLRLENGYIVIARQREKACLLIIFRDKAPDGAFVYFTSYFFGLLLVGLLLAAATAHILVNAAMPTAKHFKEEVEEEIRFSQRSFHTHKEALRQFAARIGEKRHRLECSIGETTRINNRFLGDLDEILNQLASIHGSLGKQSHTIKRMTDSLEEMSSAVKSVATNASDAVSTSKASEEDAKRGGDVVNQIIKHMNKITGTTSKSARVIRELGKRSTEIGDIINVIDDIADQTELLALNAAIEAARAGAQGRGFAVVADQVRNLAEKTTHATKEIAATLSSIQEETSRAVSAMDEGLREIDLGAGFAVQAGVSLRKIVSGAKKVTEMISSIAESAERQSQATNATTNLVSKVSGETSTTLGESQSALTCSRELAEHLGKLSQLIEHFLVIWSDSQLEYELIALGELINKEIVRRSERLEKISGISL